MSINTRTLFFLPKERVLGSSARRISHIATQLVSLIAAQHNCICSDHPAYVDTTGVVSILSRQSALIEAPNFGVIFSDQDLSFFQNLDKPQAQFWILALNSWRIRPEELGAPGELAELDGIVVQSEAHKTECVLNGWPIGKIYIVPHGVNTSFFSQAKIVRSEDSILTFFDQISIEEFELIASAVSLSKSKHSQLKLTICATGSIPAWLLSHARYDKSFMQLIQNPKQVELPAIYSSHSIIIVLPQNRAYALEALEAQACGCIPVIVSDGDAINSIEPKCSGTICSLSDSTELSSVVCKTFDALQSSPEAIQKARSFIETFFPVSFPAYAYLRVLNQLVEQRHRERS